MNEASTFELQQFSSDCEKSVGLGVAPSFVIQELNHGGNAFSHFLCISNVFSYLTQFGLCFGVYLFGFMFDVFEYVLF